VYICVTGSKLILKVCEFSVTALSFVQSTNFDKFSCKHQECVAYINELRSCIARMESELTHRLLQRNEAFPTVRYVSLFNIRASPQDSSVYSKLLQ